MLDSVAFDDSGLVPVIAQDAASGQVLMVAWMNREALAETLESGRAVYWSRSRQRLWRKGETSGHVQHVRGLRLDCDGDVILMSVEQVGGIACHTGRAHCFYRELDTISGQWRTVEPVVRAPESIYGDAAGEQGANGADASTAGAGDGAAPARADRIAPARVDRAAPARSAGAIGTGSTGSSPVASGDGDDGSARVLTRLARTLDARRGADPASSYAASLFGRGTDTILRKIGEESVELILAAKGEDDAHVVAEVADVWFHTLVLMSHRGLGPGDILAELTRREGVSGHAEKAARAVATRATTHGNEPS